MVKVPGDRFDVSMWEERGSCVCVSTDIKVNSNMTLLVQDMPASLAPSSTRITPSEPESFDRMDWTWAIVIGLGRSSARCASISY